MSRKSRNMFMLIALLLVVSMVAAACGGDEDKKENVKLEATHTSDSGLSFKYPEGWAVQDEGDGTVILAVNEEMLGENVTEMPDDGYGIVFFTPDTLAMIGVTGTPSGVLEGYKAMMGGETGGAEFGDVKTEKFGGKDAARMSIKAEDLEQQMVAVDMGDGVVVLMSVVGGKDGLKKYEDVAGDVVETLSYTAPAAPADDMTDGGEGDDAAPADDASDGGEGEDAPAAEG